MTRARYSAFSALRNLSTGGYNVNQEFFALVRAVRCGTKDATIMIYENNRPRHAAPYLHY